jgi:hypothetical protein
MHPHTTPLWNTTRIFGLIYFLLLGLWCEDFSNMMQRPYNRKYRTPSFLVRLYSWFLVTLIATGTCIWHGIKYNDSTTRGFGITILALDVYSHYSDWFWWNMNRPLFFAVLAGSFALIGWGAEKMWRVQTGSTRGQGSP